MLKVISAFVIGFIACASILWLAPKLRDKTMRYDRDLDTAFGSVTFHMPRSAVRKLMKSEGKRSEIFHLGQPAGFKFEYDSAAKSGAAYFISWQTGVDWVFTIGFDSKDRAVYKAQGGT